MARMSTHVTNRHLGDRLHMARRQRRITQGQIASHVGVSRPTVSNWEAGNSTPDVNQAISLAKMLGVDLYWLATGSAEDDTEGDASRSTGRSVDQDPLPGLSTYALAA